MLLNHCFCHASLAQRSQHKNCKPSHGSFCRVSFIHSADRKSAMNHSGNSNGKRNNNQFSNLWFNNAQQWSAYRHAFIITLAQYCVCVVIGTIMWSKNELWMRFSSVITFDCTSEWRECDRWNLNECNRWVVCSPVIAVAARRRFQWQFKRIMLRTILTDSTDHFLFASCLKL